MTPACARRKLRAFSLCIGLGSSAWLPLAHAEAPAVTVEATPLLGAGGDEASFRSVLVRLSNGGSAPLSGSVELEPEQRWSRNAVLVTRAPFSLAPHAKVSLQLPTSSVSGTSAWQVSVRSADGSLLSSATLPAATATGALLFDFASPSRLAPLLRSRSFVSRRTSGYARTPPVSAINVASAVTDPVTGDRVLPERASGYSEATLVLAAGRDLSRSSEVERNALADWVLGGGALALFLDRPEELTSTWLEALLGGPVHRTDSAPAALREHAAFLVAPDETEHTTTTPPLLLLRVEPSVSVSRRLIGFSGANLRDSPWGQSASYGLGEVHLLAFDPKGEAEIADPWTHHKLTDLLRHAHERAPQGAQLHSAGFPGESNLDAVRRELDPNQTSRWTVIVSAVLLLVYAVVAGPWNFRSAARRGKPLSALWRLAWLSLGTWLLIAGLGVFGKGISGRGRRLSLLEAGAGMTRAHALRFRGFYGATARDLTVRGTRREDVLDAAGNEASLPRTLVVDRDGTRLEGLRTKPWQTVLTREVGFAELSGGISVLPLGEDFVLKNRAARDLVGVVARAPRGQARYFARIRDGASAKFSSGKPLGRWGLPTTPGIVATPLDAARFAPALDGDFPGLGKAWTALESSLSSETDWWPDDVPVVLAAFDGGEGKLFDSGFAVDYDRCLIRVVGQGGTE